MKNIGGISKWVLAVVIGTCLLAYSPRTPIKVIGTQLLAITEYATTTQAYSSTHPVDGKILVKVTCFFASRSTSSGTAGVNFNIQGAVNDPPVAGKWDRLATLTTGFAAANTQTTGTEAAGSTVIEFGTTTGFVVNGYVFFANGTVANGEWHEIKTVTAATSITLKEAIVNAQSTVAIYTQGQILTAIVDVSTYNDIRIEVDGLARTQNYSVQIIVSDVQ